MAKATRITIDRTQHDRLLEIRDRARSRLAELRIREAEVQGVQIVLAGPDDQRRESVAELRGAIRALEHVLDADY